MLEKYASFAETKKKLTVEECTEKQFEVILTEVKEKCPVKLE